MGFGQLGSGSGNPPGGDFGAYGRGSDYGVFGASSVGFGVMGSSSTSDGVYGYSDTGIGIEGISNSGYGVHGVNTSGASLAGYFEGTVNVTQVLSAGGLASGGSISKGGACNFKIDHPLDPANKYLYHSAVESADMKNIYDGVAVLDEQGEAAVELPPWFEPLNQDFRYQLTAIGTPGPALHIAGKIHANRFRIAGGEPGMEVSWQVTGIRHDLYASAHRSPVEEEKPEAERGYYLHPALYNAPVEKGVEWARHARMAQGLKVAEAREHQGLIPRPAPGAPAESRLAGPPNGE